MLAKRKQFLLLIRRPPCYSSKQSNKIIGRKRGKKTSTQKEKDLLSFEIWIVHNVQPDCDDDRRMFVAMTLT